ncbi:MAG: 50S ribosomal protein L19e [Candidatus ainarchaeum sp.]|jgi:large subunit ribosomal protein L19e|nr:50S ribosomal protein L19e [Candidatus ainarchaeum sp.]MDD3085757.1 50S ribosomal protein L19e [Candidatus ainarchaeum sp.]MDD4128490.1 50S ribosomal protein L19e [Candidatus ainarchaeum sp.]MDD4467968.1 50S ribosomal protein L19e [Candidatus ainarchaeum sp.]HPM85545.1 50S ribosomal protein L19e [archaeon]
MNALKAKELAAKILKVGLGRIYLDPTQASKVSEAMTKDDVRTLIAERVIKKRPQVSQSRGRTRAGKEARAKGRGRGKGKRSATRKVRSEQKSRWMNRVRSQRRTLKELKIKNSQEVKEIGYSKIYNRIKGGYFRGKRHLVEFIEGAKK